MKFIVSIIVVSVALLFGGAFLYSKNQSDAPSGEVISRNGFHWHPKLAIYIKGEKQAIPTNVGIGPVHLPIHTHDDIKDDVLHMEFSGLVRTDETKLGQFFQTWGQSFNASSILDKTNGADGTVNFLVNGQANQEFENYKMKDGDKIEIRFE